MLEYFHKTEIHNKILNALAISGYLSRGELLRLTGYSCYTLYKNLEQLEKRKYIKRFYKHKKGRRGRPPVYWCLKDD